MMQTCGLRGAVVSVLTFKAKGRGFKSTLGFSHMVQKPQAIWPMHVKHIHVLTIFTHFNVILQSVDEVTIISEDLDEPNAIFKFVVEVIIISEGSAEVFVISVEMMSLSFRGVSMRLLSFRKSR